MSLWSRSATEVARRHAGVADAANAERAWPDERREKDVSSSVRPAPQHRIAGPSRVREGDADYKLPCIPPSVWMLKYRSIKETDPDGK